MFRPWGTSCRVTKRAAGKESEPQETPAEIIDKLNKEIGVGLADPKIKERIAELGGTVLAGSPADFGKRVSDDVEKWAKVIKFAHIKSD